MNQEQAVDLGKRIFIYQSLFDALDPETQVRLEEAQLAHFEKYSKFAKDIDAEISPQLEKIEAAVIEYAQKFLADIHNTVESLYPIENEVE